MNLCVFVGNAEKDQIAFFRRALGRQCCRPSCGTAPPRQREYRAVAVLPAGWRRFCIDEVTVLSHNETWDSGEVMRPGDVLLAPRPHRR